ncbi:NAD(P)-binding domain-containing protein [Oceanisphaera avium]|uniref:NAD-dependent dehydratase n=1 Tax=Oceanisphaera avium TaxID=1903694 RepID=A0A1Y0CXW7_9GAMM|nr:NAD(P)-binding domain-containing protein [Oceanisphaera avium]ART79695.1 NAD-dependent dehydratase [Oceanisphaera avium]
MSINEQPNAERVAIVGLGWLGEPLALTLQRLGYQVSGTTTTPEKAERLNKQGITTLLWELNHAMPARWPSELNADTLIICVPPGKLPHYTEQLSAVAKLAAAAGFSRLIYTSATSIYGGEGIKQEADAKPDSERGERMQACETAMHNSGIARVLCLRLSGLVGGSREPGRFLAGRSFEGGDEPINLVAQEDLLRFFPALLAKNDWPAALNVSAPHHPSRKAFYSQAAKLRQLPPPNFSGGGVGKTIDGSAISRYLGLDYLVSDWFDWLAARNTK